MAHFQHLNSPVCRCLALYTAQNPQTMKTWFSLFSSSHSCLPAHKEGKFQDHNHLQKKRIRLFFLATSSVVVSISPLLSLSCVSHSKSLSASANFLSVESEESAGRRIALYIDFTDCWSC